MRMNKANMRKGFQQRIWRSLAKTFAQTLIIYIKIEITITWFSQSNFQVFGGHLFQFRKVEAQSVRLQITSHWRNGGRTQLNLNIFHPLFFSFGWTDLQLKFYSNYKFPFLIYICTRRTQHQFPCCANAKRCAKCKIDESDRNHTNYNTQRFRNLLLDFHYPI